MSLQNELDKYKKLPWTKVFVQNDDGTYFAKIQELKGCMTEGEDINDAAIMLDDALEAWLSVALEKNISIPLPGKSQDIEKYSGKLIIRIPRSLHRDLVSKASFENVSLNALISNLLSKTVDA